MLYYLQVVKTTGTHYTKIEAATVQQAEEMVRRGEFEGGEFRDENIKVVVTGSRCKDRDIKVE